MAGLASWGVGAGEQKEKREEKDWEVGGRGRRWRRGEWRKRRGRGGRSLKPANFTSRSICGIGREASHRQIPYRVPATPALPFPPQHPAHTALPAPSCLRHAFCIERGVGRKYVGQMARIRIFLHLRYPAVTQLPRVSSPSPLISRRCRRRVRREAMAVARRAPAGRLALRV